MKLQYLLIAAACLGMQTIRAEEAVTYAAQCFETSALFNELKTKYKETPIILGIASDEAKSTMSFWINPSNGSWSIIATKKDTSCIIGTGVDLTIVPKGTSI
jgi:hypothetical protein